MTYFQFHLIFNIPLLIVLLVAGWNLWAAPGVLGVALLVWVPVLLFTTPWDNYAARHGIWGFPPKQYWRRIGHLPVEEYLFFLIQASQAMALTVLVIGWLGPFQSGVMDPELRGVRLTVVAIAAFLWIVFGVSVTGRVRRLWGGRVHYAWHLLYWFIPLIAFQWVIAPDVLAPRWTVLAVVTVGLGGYLSWADWMAIRRGIWFFDHRQTTGINVAPGMPWEEAAFFLLTSLLVSQSFLMLLPEAVR